MHNETQPIPRRASADRHLRRAFADLKEAHSLLLAYHERLEQLHALGESSPAEEESARALKIQDALPNREQA